MVTREHYETFCTLRNKAVSYRTFSQFQDETLDEERVVLVNRDENETVEMHSLDTPYWVAYVEQFRFEADKVNQKITQLEEIQKNILKLKNKEIFGDDSNDKKHHELDKKCQEITKLFGRLYSLVNHIKNIPKESGMKVRLMNNILQWEYQVISRLSANFRETQKIYLNKLREYDKFMINFDDPQNSDEMVINHYSPNLFENLEEQATNYSDIANTQQVHLLHSENKFLQSREQEMTNIMKSMEELNEIFHNINVAVITQGSLLDRIDYNLENVHMSVQQGVVELSKAERRMRRSRKVKCILGIAFSIFLFLIIAIMRS